MKHHHIGWLIVAIAAVMTIGDGWWFSIVEHIALWHGIYCIWMTAITVGGDVQPIRQGYICLSIAPVPLLGAAFSLFTSALSSVHIRKAKSEMIGALGGSTDAN